MYEPPQIEIILTKLLGTTLVKPYYKEFVRSLELAPSERVLDFCSGSGIISDILLKGIPQGFLTCADVSLKWLAEVRRRIKSMNFETVYLSDMRTPALEKASYDKAVIHFALHDFKKADRLKVLDLVTASLKPGGKLTIREPITEGHGMKLYEVINLLEQLKITHYTYSQKRFPLVGETLDFRITV